MHHDSSRAAALAIAVLAAACSHQGQTTNVAVTRTYADTVGRRAGDGAAYLTTIEDFHGPESVRYDPDQDVYFVSNMAGYGSVKDGNGYIVRISASDLYQKEIFVQGGKNGAALDSPKGMAIHGDTLWVADIDKLRGFDRHSGQTLATIDLAPYHAVLLNDVAVGGDGTVRVTDTGIDMSPKGVIYMGGDKVFVIGPHASVSLAQSGDSLREPNGITWDKYRHRWLMVTFDPFRSELRDLGADGRQSTVLVHGRGKFDGVEVIGDNQVLYTCWKDSSVHLYSSGKDVQIVRRAPEPADIGFDARRRILAIPISAMDRVEFWRLGRR